MCGGCENVGKGAPRRCWRMKRGGTTPGVCALCLEEGPLSNSHALPHAHFKDIHRRNSGVAIAISTDSSKLHKTSESGKAILLCASCEGRLNLAFDSPCINYLKQVRLTPGSAKPGMTIQCSPDTLVSSDTLAWFMISVVWRAAISTADIYAELRISERSAEVLRTLIWEQSSSPYERAAFSLFDLYDSRGIFNRAALMDFVMPPVRPEKSSRVDFIAGGFLFSVDFSALSFSQRQRSGLLRPGTTVIRVPPMDVRRHSGFVAMTKAGIEKYRRDQITFGKGKNDR